MPLVELDANKICTLCGRFIGTGYAMFRSTDKNRFLYEVCDWCTKRIREEGKKLGLDENRITLESYTQAKWLVEQRSI